MRRLPDGFSSRFLAIKLIERDPCVRRSLEPLLTPDDRAAVDTRLAELESLTEQRAEYVMSSVRHSLAFDVFEAVARAGVSPQSDVRHRLDELLMHPVLGYVFLLAVLAATFAAVFKVGSTVEPLLLAGFARLGVILAQALGRGTLLLSLANGVVSGS